MVIFTDVPQRPEKYSFSQVLCVVDISGAVIDIIVDATHIALVEQTERLGVALHCTSQHNAFVKIQSVSAFYRQGRGRNRQSHFARFGCQ